MHGRIGRGGLPRQGKRATKRFIPGFVARVLIREVLLGLLLYIGVSSGSIQNLEISLAVLLSTILFTRRFGLLTPRGWGMAVAEGLMIFSGSLAVRNILAVLPGLFH